MEILGRAAQSPSPANHSTRRANEHELATGAIRRIAHVLDDKTSRSEGFTNLGPPPEAQRRVRREHGAVGRKDEVRTERGEGGRDRDELDPALDRTDLGQLVAPE